eukprot:Selendium_serpulae@DN5185_c0_g1_i2.p1
MTPQILPDNNESSFSCGQAFRKNDSGVLIMRPPSSQASPDGPRSRKKIPIDDVFNKAHAGAPRQEQLKSTLKIAATFGVAKRWLCCLLVGVLLILGLTYDLASRQWRLAMGFVAAVLTLVGLLGSGELVPLAKRHRFVCVPPVVLFTVYLSALMGVLFQSLEDARSALHAFDERTGVFVDEYNHAADCSLSLSNVGEKVDFFVFGHAAGWAFKACLLREVSTCFILSVVFEVIEYLLAFQLSNFQECWWDTFVMDVLLCNTAGIIGGMWFLKRILGLPTFDWVVAYESESNDEDESHEANRAEKSSKNRWRFLIADGWISYIAFVALAATIMLCEVNFFYLKHVLYIPPSNGINIVRVILHACYGLLAISDYHEYRKGRILEFPFYAIMYLMAVFMELCVIVKFSRGQFGNPMPSHTCYLLYGILFSLAAGIPILLFSGRKFVNALRTKTKTQ